MQIDPSSTTALVKTAQTSAALTTVTRGEYQQTRATDRRGETPAPAQAEETKHVEAAIEAFNEVAEPLGVALQFTRDEDSGKIVIKMIDENTGDTLRQFPNETVLRLAASMGKMRGSIVDRQM